jgi:hypothetical protein
MEEGVRGVGRATFAAVLLMIGGILNIIWGIAAIGNSHFFNHNQHYVFASLKGYGWIALILGILELLASISLFGGGAYGKWFGVIMGSLAAIDALLSIPAYPFWSIAVFALSLWIVHGLLVLGEEDWTYNPGTGAASREASRVMPPPPH